MAQAKTKAASAKRAAPVTSRGNPKKLSSTAYLFGTNIAPRRQS